MEIIKNEEISEEGFRNEVILRNAQKNIYVLNRNGFDVQCPFQPPMKIPKQSLDVSTPQIQIVHAACMSTCVHFQINDNGDNVDVSLGCGNTSYKNLKK